MKLFDLIMCYVTFSRITFLLLFQFLFRFRFRFRPNWRVRRCWRPPSLPWPSPAAWRQKSFPGEPDWQSCWPGNGFWLPNDAAGSVETNPSKEFGFIPTCFLPVDPETGFYLILCLTSWSGIWFYPILFPTTSFFKSFCWLLNKW